VEDVVKKAVLKMSGIKLKPSQVHKMRGFIGDVFKEHDLVHNHDVETGKVIYRYPLIQFKVIDNSPVIIALTEKAVNVFGEIFMKLDHIKIEELTIPVNEKELSVEEDQFGMTKEMIQYEFIHPWVALNQENYKKYHELESFAQKKEMLSSVMIGNILSMSKYLDYTVKDEIKIETTLKPVNINLKTKSMMGFIGGFRTNFEIPDLCGLGKSVSRGYGTVKRVEK
jgi:hypothetical protein